MERDTPSTLVWSAHLRDAHWRCELARAGGVWYARVLRNGELAAWYQAGHSDAALKWADALAAVFADGAAEEH